MCSVPLGCMPESIRMFVFGCRETLTTRPSGINGFVRLNDA